MIKYKIGDKLKHVTSGDNYVIVAYPNDNRLLESTGDRFYEYRANGGDIVWHRAEREMEDGRFILVEA